MPAPRLKTGKSKYGDYRARGSVNAERLEIVLADRGEGEIAVVRDAEGRAVRRVDRVGAPAVDDDLPDISDVPQAENGELPFGHNQLMVRRVHR